MTKTQQILLIVLLAAFMLLVAFAAPSESPGDAMTRVGDSSIEAIASVEQTISATADQPTEEIAPSRNHVLAPVLIGALFLVGFACNRSRRF